MSETDGLWFEVTINYSPGPRPDRRRKIGPYRGEDLNDFGEPPADDMTNAVWEMIGDFVGINEIKD